MKPAVLTLRLIFILTVSFLTLLITISLTYFVSRQYEKEAMAHLSHYVETVAQDVALAATEYIITENFSSLQDLILSYHDRTHIRSLVVTDAFQTVIASSRPEQLGENVSFPHQEDSETASTSVDSVLQFMQYTIPVRIGGTTVGWCLVQLNTSHIRKDLSVLQQRAVVLGTAIWLLASVIAYFLSSFVTVSIRGISSVARQVSAGDFANHAEVRGPQEIRELASAFNMMLAAIENRTKLLEISEKKYRMLVEDMNDWVWEVDLNGVRKYVSPSVEKTLGYTPGELLGKSIFGSMPSKKAETIQTLLLQLIETKSSFTNVMHSQYHKDGHEVIVETAGQPIVDSSGDVVGFRGVARDVTKRYLAEKELQAEKERLSVTLRSIGDGVITTDIDGRIVFLNRAAEELTGWSSEAAEGKISSEIFHIVNEETQEPCNDPVHQILSGKTVVGQERNIRLVTRDGLSRVIADNGAPILDKDAKVIGVVLVFRDITHEKKTEEELLKIRKLESVGVLAGGIAHDFNNILSAILGNIELARYRVADRDVRATTLLLDAEKATQRAAKLTRQLLTFSKGGEPIREETDLPKLITESADFVLRGSNVACTYHFVEDLWLVDVDSGQVSQVIQNIIINARHAMPEGGTIEIRCDNVTKTAAESLPGVTGGEFVRVAIQDTGSGIPAEIITKVFDPYFTTRDEGSGLGLAISHSIVMKHGGCLRVSSAPGEGTTFEMYLPVVHSSAEMCTDTPRRKTVPEGLHILVMDNDEMILTVTEAQLVALGHKAVLVIDGDQAISRYLEMKKAGTPFDLVIMDLTIPGGMGGRDAAAELLRIDAQARLIVASGYSNDPVMAEYGKYGFRAAIAKPFDLTGLENAISSAL